MLKRKKNTKTHYHMLCFCVFLFKVLLTFPAMCFLCFCDFLFFRIAFLLCFCSSRSSILPFFSSSNVFFGTFSMCCCLFSFYFLFSFSLPFFMLILFSFFLFVFKILLSRTLSLFLFMLHFVLLSDGAAVSLLPSESNQTKLWKWVPHSIFLAIQQNVQSTI